MRSLIAAPIELPVDAPALPVTSNIADVASSAIDGDADLAWAYAVQRAFVAQAWPGEAVVGRKIGLTSPAVQAQLGVDQPDFGTLFSSMEVANGSTIRGGRFLQPRVEGEIAFRLGTDLDPADGAELTIDDVRAAITGAAAAIEVCDSRIEGWDIRLTDTVADNASAGGYVLGERWVPLSEFEPKEARMTMTVTSRVGTGREPITGDGAACLGDPLLAVLWLAQTCARLGDPLRAGEVVLSGALAPMADLAPGTHVDVTVTGLGSVAVSREEASPMTFDGLRDAAIRVVEALAARESASGGPGLAYAEVVVTMPASLGADLAPVDIEPAMADIVSGVEDAGAARGKAVLLLNPAEIAPRVSVLALLADGDGGDTTRDPSERDVDDTSGALNTHLSQALTGSDFVLLQPIQPQTIDVDAARTLVPHALTSGGGNLQRIDVLLQAEVAR